jgi:hypothetical protein
MATVVEVVAEAEIVNDVPGVMADSTMMNRNSARQQRLPLRRVSGTGIGSADGAGQTGSGLRRRLHRDHVRGMSIPAADGDHRGTIPIILGLGRRVVRMG